MSRRKYVRATGLGRHQPSSIRQTSSVLTTGRQLPRNRSTWGRPAATFTSAGSGAPRGRTGILDEGEALFLPHLLGEVARSAGGGAPTGRNRSGPTDVRGFDSMAPSRPPARPASSRSV